MARTLTWTTTRGVTKTITIGGRRDKRFTAPADPTISLDDFLADQRARVARAVDAWYIGAANEGVNPRTETMIERRA